MSVFGFLVLLLIAGICGSIGQSIAGYSRGGCMASIGIGFVGAVLGVWIARFLQLPNLFALNIEGSDFPIIWAILGSSVFVALIALVARRR